jgi:non-specific serine/threonine protein kinase
MIKSYILAFDLYLEPDLKVYIPRALVINKHENSLGYMEKYANQETLASYDIDCNEITTDLLDLCDRLSPQALYKKYNAKLRKPRSISELLKEEKFKTIILQYIKTLRQQFFKLISPTKIPLSINLQRQNRFETHRVVFADVALIPKLYFHKMEDKMEYHIRLQHKDKTLIPSRENLLILLDYPAFVLYNKTIFRLKYINANKLKPFLTKEIISIPKRSSVKYFNTFIKKVIKKAPIEAKGFEVITHNTCLSCTLKPTTTIFSDTYHLELFFNYTSHSFSILDQTQKHIKLEHDGKNDFRVYETVRHAEQEQNFIAVLERLGLVFLESNLATFYTDVKNIDVYDNVIKLIELKDKLHESGISLDLKLHRFKINDNTSTISTSYNKKEDWFDVEMQINVGAYQFPFSSLVSHIQSGERLYELPDGSSFIIPKEWFSRYKSIIELGTVEKNRIKIQKNHFTVLEQSGISMGQKVHKDILPYQSTGHLRAELREYQKAGANWLLKNHQIGLGSCLADDMGLGKTLQTLAYLDFVYTCFESEFLTREKDAPLDLFSVLQENTKSLKALVVTPSSLTFNWQSEVQKFCPHFSTLSYVGQDRKSLRHKLSNVDMVLTSYGILLRDINFLKTLPFNFIIIDESQQIKNRNSKIFKAINSIEAKYKISLSGTPMENSLSDLWSQMQFINPNLLGSYTFFNNHFKKPIEKDKDDTKLKELKLLISPYLLRRTKDEVAKDLPELSEQVYYVELTPIQAKLYEKEKSKVRNYLVEKTLENGNISKRNFRLSVLNSLMKLRQLANHPRLVGDSTTSGKFEAVTAYLETLVQAKQKVLIFSTFTSHLQIYTDWCNAEGINYNLLTGNTAVKDREKEVLDFKSNADSLLFFISLKAGGTGLNLTQASYVIILDPWWNPFAELQAIGRAHRIGQTQKVNVVRFIAKKTIEEKINELQLAKKNLSDSIIENQITDDILNNIERILD